MNATLYLCCGSLAAALAALFSAVAWLLRVTVNRSWRGPSVLVGANDDPAAKAEQEAAGEFQCVYYDVKGNGEI